MRKPPRSSLGKAFHLRNSLVQVSLLHCAGRTFASFRGFRGFRRFRRFRRFSGVPRSLAAFANLRLPQRVSLEATLQRGQAKAAGGSTTQNLLPPVGFLRSPSCRRRKVQASIPQLRHDNLLSCFPRGQSHRFLHERCHVRFGFERRCGQAVHRMVLQHTSRHRSVQLRLRHELIRDRSAFGSGSGFGFGCRLLCGGGEGHEVIVLLHCELQRLWDASDLGRVGSVLT
eukprot:scaffold2720_cov212-Pinguiococcus_pyrenoidosus.AAC.9